MSDVLPAPLGPIIAVKLPGEHSIEMLSKSCFEDALTRIEKFKLLVMTGMGSGENPNREEPPDSISS